MPPRTVSPVNDALDREALFAEAAFTCDHAARVRLVGEWMPVAHEGASDKIYTVTGGRGTLWLGGDRYDLRPGQVMLIPAGTVQRGESDPAAPLEKNYIHFSSLTTNTLHLLRFFPPPRRLIGQSAAAITERTQRLFHEWEGSRPGRRLALKSLLIDILLTAYRADAADHLPPDAPNDAPPPHREFRGEFRGGLSDEHYDTIRRSLSLLTTRLDEPWTLAALAEHAALSPSHFNRLFARLVGMPPMRFLETRRMRRAQELLVMSETPIAKVAERVGYSDPNYFSRAFQRFVGCSPTAYRAATRAGRPEASGGSGASGASRGEQ